MNKKQTIIIFVLFVVIALLVLVFPRDDKGDEKKLLLLPTKENPSPHGLYSNVPPFDEWQWKEEYNEEGKLIYRIKLPMDGKYFLSEYVGGSKYGGRYGNIGIIKLDLTEYKSSNILDYVNNNDDQFAIRYWNLLGESGLGKFHTFSMIEQSVSHKGLRHYILTKKNIVLIRFDNLENCYEISIKEQFIPHCVEYQQIYFPIVEKILLTLEIPDYVDDRGFAPEELWEIKLLPDALRIYEVK